MGTIDGRADYDPEDNIPPSCYWCGNLHNLRFQPEEIGVTPMPFHICIVCDEPVEYREHTHYHDALTFHICSECGAMVINTDKHTEWHRIR